jgi:dTDP-4-amino-4,6-dideoxy-D-galactose acyltransferase
MKIKVCNWDSLFFNKRVGEIDFDKTNQSSMELNGFDLLYVKQNSEEFFEIDNFEHTYTETKVVFSKSVHKINKINNNYIFSAFDRNISKEQIYKLAFESGKFSRFKLDNKFKQSEFEELYKTWIDNSLSKELADNVLVYCKEGIVLGFITYKVSESYGTIGLLATDLKSQGKGIGSLLVKSVENQLKSIMINELRIPTQIQNRNACSFYIKLGYVIKETSIIKHYWRK